MRSKLRTVLSWTGLLVMAICLVWLESLPRIERPVQPRAARVAGLFPLVVLDPGHGGQDSGAMCGGVMEKDLTLDVAHRVDRLLEAEGIATVMTRLGDNYV